MPVTITIYSCRDCINRYYNRSLEEYVCLKLSSKKDNKYMLGTPSQGESIAFRSMFVTYDKDDTIPKECPLRK